MGYFILGVVILALSFTKDSHLSTEVEEETAALETPSEAVAEVEEAKVDTVKAEEAPAKA